MHQKSLPLTSTESVKPPAADEVVIVGRLGAPHGVRGEIHIHSYTTPVENLLDYKPWLFRRRPEGRKGSKRSYVSRADKRSDSDRTSRGPSADWQALEVSGLRVHQDHYLARIEGFDEREDVATLKGVEIGVARGQLPDPDNDEFYWRDLSGARVINEQNQPLGTVAGLLETGVHDVLRVRPDTPGHSEVLIPFVKAYVLSVTAEEIKVDWDPSWLSG